MFWWFFKHTAHFSMDLPFFFLLCSVTTSFFSPSHIFSIFSVELVWHFLPHLSGMLYVYMQFPCVVSGFCVYCHTCFLHGLGVLCTFQHPDSIWWFFCAYLVLLFAGFLCVPFFSSVGQSSRGYFPKFLVCFSILYVLHLLACICEAEF